MDAYLALNRKKHPFFSHSEAGFFLASRELRDGDVAETARQMRADMKNLNGVEYKNHRVYRKML